MLILLRGASLSSWLRLFCGTGRRLLVNYDKRTDEVAASLRSCASLSFVGKGRHFFVFLSQDL